MNDAAERHSCAEAREHFEDLLDRGDYRLVYELHDDRLLVLVIRIGHRREVYRRLG